MNNFKYTPSADAVYIKMLDSEICQSEEIKDGIIYDYDKDDNVVGIEILFVKKRSPEELEAFGFNFSEEDREMFRKFGGAFA
ncbi:DUF2283 domain-containing protein [Myxosarcina sp. GI1]|uniref:DUF2283 domain-containing protein n=1 Tax=Myxosarcina sp. GI1 TaxID=1541065 RepID=UPI00056C2F83|nr:DUF2283 domain-containing protein [Myxosarcina sp. GI1]